MNQIIMWIMAVGAVLGGVDRIAGNRFGLGKRFGPRSHLELFWAGCGTSRRHSRH